MWEKWEIMSSSCSRISDSLHLISFNPYSTYSFPVLQSLSPPLLPYPSLPFRSPSTLILSYPFSTIQPLFSSLVLMSFNSYSLLPSLSYVLQHLFSPTLSRPFNPYSPLLFRCLLTHILSSPPFPMSFNPYSASPSYDLHLVFSPLPSFSDHDHGVNH